ncbi:trypsin-like peptidase domain-containing protein [Patescibacteria group bacterium]|nr:trypsin-like peptidase domain-containing protein [Patescibacteria group bacterium]MBU1868808.1 trypsin-like peptidase domain-containing protein [Patescibacteria group bacterium]
MCKGSSFSKLLGFFLLVVTALSLGGVMTGWVEDLNWQDIWPLTKIIERETRTEEIVQRVVQEESAVIEVVEIASPSVVSVLEKQLTYDFFRGPVLEESSIGTGFAVDKDLIVTNRHVVSSSSAEYTVVDNQETRFAVTKIYRDPLNDIAILKVDDGDFTGIELGDSESIKVGQTVVAIGNALGRFANTVTRGVISGIGRGITASSGLGSYQQLEDVIQTDAALNPGNSGGPLLNLAVQVIGVNVAVGQGTENIGFAIPINSVATLLEDFRANKTLSRPYLGVSYLAVTEELAEERDLVAGAYVNEVLNNTAAEKAGVKKGDIITHMGGVKVDKENTLGKLILKHKAGDKIVIKVWRNGQDLELEVTLGEAPVE